LESLIAGHLCNLEVLGGELVETPKGAFAGVSAGRNQLMLGALCESVHADSVEQLMPGAELLAPGWAATIAARPLAVQQVSASNHRTKRGAAQPLDRLAIQVVGGRPLAQHPAAPRLKA
jgi:hypothetical protein